MSNYIGLIAQSEAQAEQAFNILVHYCPTKFKGENIEWLKGGEAPYIHNPNLVAIRSSSDDDVRRFVYAMFFKVAYQISVLHELIDREGEHAGRYPLLSLDGDEIVVMSKGTEPEICSDLGYGYIEMDKHGLPILHSIFTSWVSKIFNNPYLINKKILKIVNSSWISQRNAKVAMRVE
jgi:hypothetical protein